MGWVGLLFLVLNLTVRVSNCSPDGEDNADVVVLEPRITGGEEAPIGRFPYMCSLRQRGSRTHKCGGTLIRSQWVLTAAHCLDPRHRNSVGLTPVVYCGSHTSETNDPDLIFNAVEGFVHTSWTGNVNDGYDVGLLKLDRESNTTLPAIDTQQTPLASGELLTALGWGETDSQQTAQTLQMAANLHYLLPARCKRELGNVFKPRMICAGLLNQDTCRGDSGGPLLIPDKPNGNITAGLAQTDLIVGVTSSGVEACDASIPGVYVRISYMSEWILSVIDGEACQARGSKVGSSQPANPIEPIEEIASPVEAPEESESSVISVGAEDSPGKDLGPEALTTADFDLTEVISLIEADHAGTLEVLVSAGLNPNTRHNDSSFGFENLNDTLLHWAARFGATECAEVLIDNGANLEAKNTARATPLHATAVLNTFDTAKILLERGAETEARSWTGTPLHYACTRSHVEVAEVLLENGANIEARNAKNLTPLIIASSRFSHDVDLVEVLLSYDANIDAVDNNGQTPLHWASLFGHLDIARILVETGASKEALDDNGNTPWDIICSYEEVDCSELTKRTMTELLSP